MVGQGQAHLVVSDQGQGHLTEIDLGLLEEGHHTDALYHLGIDQGLQEGGRLVDWGQEVDLYLPEDQDQVHLQGKVGFMLVHAFFCVIVINLR